jgi:hypothetical protein
MISYQYVDGLEIRNNELLNKIEQLQSRCAELERERAEVAWKAFVDGANWWAQCEQNDTLHLDEHEAADEYVQSEYGIKEQTQ